MQEKRVSLDKNQVDTVLSTLLTRELVPMTILEIYNIISLLRTARPIIEKDEVV